MLRRLSAQAALGLLLVTCFSLFTLEGYSAAPITPTSTSTTTTTASTDETTQDANDEAGPQVGAIVPNFELKDQDGKAVSLDELVKDGLVALVFYRSADW